MPRRMRTISRLLISRGGLSTYNDDKILKDIFIYIYVIEYKPIFEYDFSIVFNGKQVSVSNLGR